LESRLITYPDFEDNRKQKYLIVCPNQIDVAVLIKQLVRKDPMVDFYFWNGNQIELEWAQKVCNAANFVLVNTESTLDLTSNGLDVKKVVRYNNVQELFKFIYER